MKVRIFSHPDDDRLEKQINDFISTTTIKVKFVCTAIGGIAIFYEEGIFK
jgi:hypothetical protein